MNRLVYGLIDFLPVLAPVLCLIASFFVMVPGHRLSVTSLLLMGIGGTILLSGWRVLALHKMFGLENDIRQYWPTGSAFFALGMLTSPYPLAHWLCWVPFLLDAYYVDLIAQMLASHNS